MFNMGGRKRARAAEVGGAAEGEGVTDLSERTAMQFVMAALGSIERLGEAHGATAHGGALLDRAAQSVITSELVRCLGRAMVDRHPTSTPVSLSDIFDVSEFAVRILVSLPLRNRLACALVCTTWRSRVQHDCEDEDRYDSKTLRCTLLSRTKAPVIQLGLFSRGSKTFVLVRAHSDPTPLFPPPPLRAQRWPASRVQRQAGRARPRAVSRLRAYERGVVRCSRPARRSPRLTLARAVRQALSKACELTKLLCTTAPDASQQQQQQHEWNVPMVSHEAMAAWSRFWPSSGSAGAPAAEPPAGERASDQLPPDKALLHEPFDSQVVVNNAGSYLMLLQQACARRARPLLPRCARARACSWDCRAVRRPEASGSAQAGLARRHPRLAGHGAALLRALPPRLDARAGEAAVRVHGRMRYVSLPRARASVAHDPRLRAASLPCHARSRSALPCRRA